MVEQQNEDAKSNLHDVRVPGENLRKRKRIWQIESGLHCSVIGICFSRRELRSLVQKKLFSFVSGSSDFQVHQQLSQWVARRSPQARAIQKILDDKYRLAIQRYAACHDNNALQEQWGKDCLQQADIAASYWALFTHPQADGILLDQVYGYCHMKSFEPFSEGYSGGNDLIDMKRRLAAARKREIRDAEKVKKYSARLQKQSSRILEKDKIMQKQRAEIERLLAENRRLSEAMPAVPELQPVTSGTRCLGADEEREKLLQYIEKLEGEVSASADLLEEAGEAMTHMSLQLAQMRDCVEFQDGQKVCTMSSMGNDVVVSPSVHSTCESCEERLLGTCRGKKLLGKRVLYVGGLHKMVARYRQMVEERGGVFLHHDGGVENSKQKLPGMLNCADVVLCPVDCVSHDACKCLKRMCKKQDKPFVMMRSAGLSSFARGLGNFVQ